MAKVLWERQRADLRRSAKKLLQKIFNKRAAEEIMKTIPVILGLMITTSVCIADGFMPWADVAKMYDDNNDGKVTMTEVKSMEHVLGKGFVGFQPWFADHFAELDSDKDGTVSMDEMKAWMQVHKMSADDMSKGFYKGFGFMPNNQ